MNQSDLALKGESIIKRRDDRLKSIDKANGSIKSKAEEKVFWIEHYDMQLKKYGIEGLAMTNKDVDQFIFKIRQAKLISSIDEALDLGNEELFIALTSELNRLVDEHYKLLTQH